MRTFYFLLILLILIFLICSSKRIEFFSDSDTSIKKLINELLVKLTLVENKIDNYKKNEYVKVSEEIKEMRNNYDDAYIWYKTVEEENKKNSKAIVDNLNI